MEPNSVQQPIDQQEILGKLDMLPFVFTACVVVLMLLAMLSAFLSDIYATIVTRF